MRQAAAAGRESHHRYVRAAAIGAKMPFTLLIFPDPWPVVSAFFTALLDLPWPR
jgi:hypothetical protein